MRDKMRPSTGADMARKAVAVPLTAGMPFAAVLNGAATHASPASAVAPGRSGGGSQRQSATAAGRGGRGGGRGARGGGRGGGSGAPSKESTPHKSSAAPAGSGGEEEDDEEEDDDEEQKKPGRRKISIQFIEDKSKRHITFSKRKTGVIKKAKELSSLTGAHVVLLVASETGNLYDFATPRFSKVLDELKTWFHSCKKDAARIEAAAGFSLQAQTAPQFVDVEGLVDDDVDEEVELESQKRISALMQAANTAELAEREHNEMAAAAWSVSPGRKRAREWDHEGYAERPGARNGEQGAKQHNSNQNYLMLQMMNPQGGGGSAGNGQRAHSFGHSDQGPACAVLAHHGSAARGWHPRDPLPQPAAAAMGQGGASAQAKLTTDSVAETDFAGILRRASLVDAALACLGGVALPYCSVSPLPLS